jgi:hypothetical protein
MACCTCGAEVHPRNVVWCIIAHRIGALQARGRAASKGQAIRRIYRHISWLSLLSLLIMTLQANSAQRAVMDSAGLQNTIVSALVNHEPIKLRPGVYDLSSTVRLRPADREQAIEGLVIEGAGPGNTVIRWSGPPNQSVFEFAAAKYGVIGGFSVSGRAALADFDFAGHGSSGGMLLENLVFDNPARFSVRAGNPSDDTPVSEFSFHNVYSLKASVAGFQIEGYNSLNFNFYNSGCSHMPVCISNLGSLDAPGAQDGGNFNWFGGSVSDTPSGSGDVHHATFIMTTGNTYNFVGVRVEDSGTLFYSPGPTNASVMINWIGGWYASSKNADPGTRIVDYRAGGSFSSQRSLWASTGGFFFSPQTKSVAFDGDTFRLGWGPRPNQALRQYFSQLPKSVAVHTRDVSEFR